MPTLSLTNNVASQALRGQNVKITLESGYISYIQQIPVGALCNASGDLVGYVYSVDYYGNSFEIVPESPNKSFGLAGYFLNGESLDVTF